MLLKRVINNFALFLGIIGLIGFMFGLVEHNDNIKNIIILCATGLLFLSALIQKEPFFIGLQAIAFISAILVFLNLDHRINLIVFMILSIVFATFFFGKNSINLARIFAFCGLLALCIGIVLSCNLSMVICGICLSIYAVFSIQQGYSVGWVFLTLNIIFAIVSGYAFLNGF
ncbi:MFS transporter [Francisella frigiditurris]|uniref:Putative membrane protein n=1 Tax=Francisella frigiditurris TaxID=1542390 RepID=A0A1J0KU94_9GAMM|nr:MFS transporter [Francisella frigiditurris]APC97259.1 putative membrane protein [Francisella frigiditurris]